MLFYSPGASKYFWNDNYDVPEIPRIPQMIARGSWRHRKNRSTACKQYMQIEKTMHTENKTIQLVIYSNVRYQMDVQYFLKKCCTSIRAFAMSQCFSSFLVSSGNIEQTSNNLYYIRPQCLIFTSQEYGYYKFSCKNPRMFCQSCIVYIVSFLMQSL